MAKKNTSGTASIDPLAQIRIRFLHVVDLIIAKNRENGIKPDSERKLCNAIGLDANAISKIRNGRKPTKIQIYKVGIHFNLDFNYFFRDRTPQYELYNENLFVLEGDEEFAVRLKKRFGKETAMIQDIITEFREEIQRLENENADSVIVKQSKKMIEEAREKIEEAFSKNKI